MKVNYYSIKDLETLSGIKAHTIRAWEKRYDLFTPSRTESNIRLYDNSQLCKLLNVCTLLNYGWKISKISLLSKSEMQSETEKWLLDYNTQQYQAQINGLCSAMINFEEPSFEKIFANSVLKIGLTDTMIKVIYPFLQRVGMMWRTSQMYPAQEHFISSLIFKKLYTAIDSLITTDKSKSKFLLFLPEGEYHELGLLFANYLIRAKQHDVLYLGANVPYKNLKPSMEVWEPDYLLTFFMSTKVVKNAQNLLNSYSSDFPKKQILVAGPSTELIKLSTPENIVWLKCIHDLTTFLN